MKQRSAMVVAGGLVMALALAGLGLAMGMTGPSADAKAPRRAQHKAPIVHTVTRTITIHKPASSTGDVSTLSTGSAWTAGASTQSSSNEYAGSGSTNYEAEDGSTEPSDVATGGTSVAGGADD